MKIKQAGFTLIELLVVIVILGILSTIGFANFKSYYGKAFDSERKAAIKAMATMVKVDSAAEIGNTKYLYVEDGGTGNEMSELFNKNDYKVPSIQGAKCYIYLWGAVDGSAGSQNEFAIVTPLEDGTLIADGTKNLVTTLEAIAASTGITCDSAYSMPTITGVTIATTPAPKTLYLCTGATAFTDTVCGETYTPPAP